MILLVTDIRPASAPNQPAEVPATLSSKLPHVPAQHQSCGGAVQADKDVILGCQIGWGGYGKVYHSKYRDQNVAVKVRPKTPIPS